MQAGIESKRATPTSGHVRRDTGHVAGISGHVHWNTHLSKVRYRGLQKNATTALTALELANIYLGRQRLMAQVRL